MSADPPAVLAPPAASPPAPAVAVSPAAPPAPPPAAGSAESGLSRAEAVLALRVDKNLVSSTLALRRALESELGVAVADAELATPGIPRIDVVWLASGNVEVSLSSRSLPRASREVALNPQRPEDRLETIAFIAANLVRNEAAALLPDLRPIDPSAPAPVANAPEKKLVSPCDLRGEATFGIDFAPGIGASSTRSGREATRRLSLGFAGTLSSRLHGLEFSIGASIQKVSVCGGQFAVGANISRGPVQGVQYALFNLATDRFVGLQGGIVNTTHGDFYGLQSGVVNFTTGSMRGAQSGIVNYLGSDLHGAQGSVVNFAGGDATGFQGGVANLTIGNLQGLQGGVFNLTVGDLTGLQAGVVNIAAGHFEGVQVGVANYAGSVHGPQLGVLNVSAGESNGVQLGVFNYADRAKASIGLLSIVRHGRTSLDAMISVENATMLAGFTHGGQYVHNSLAAGVRTKGDPSRGVVSYALGVRPLSTSYMRVDIDAFYQLYLSEDMSNRNTSVSGLRIPVTVMLWRGFGVMAAPSYQVLVTDEARVHTKSAFGDTRIHTGKDFRVLGYAGLTLGLRYEFDHGVSSSVE